MKLTIDNLDGAGPVDYSAAVSSAAALKITRTLNAPSRCGVVLLPGPLPLPARRGRIVVTADSGTTLFTGYVATEPVRTYAGAGTMGGVYYATVEAVSDEWLLDKQTVAPSGAGLSQPVGLVLKTLTNRVDGTRFSATGVANGRTIGVFEPSAAEAWSANAGRAAGAGYASYRVVGGALTLQPAGTVTHTLNDGDGTLHLAGLKSAAVKELANDVTLSGEIEPAAFVTETFAGDGTTSVFAPAQAPFRAKRSRLLSDSFNQSGFDPRVWSVTDPGSHLGLSAAGLTITGGNGLDGQTTLTAIDAVEMGGSIVVEAGSLQLTAGSAGVVCGLYQGSAVTANCFAGYNVRQSGGNTVVTALVNGAEAGTTYTLVAGHRYTLRIRLHAVEMQRVQQTFYAMIDGVVQAFGGALVAAAMALVFELQDLGVSSNTPATVLYDGSVASSPASCTFVAVNSLQLLGTMGYCRVTQTGSAWVVSTLPGGTKQTRLIGAAGEGVDCRLSATGAVTFFAGRIPVAGEYVTVVYRGSQRSLARIADATSVAAETAAGQPGTAAWRGRVLSPPARSSVDCENAAAAVLKFAVSRSAAIAGSYVAVNPASGVTGDIWPGDVLGLTSGGVTTSVMVHGVVVEDGGTRPETLTYRIGFANDWAEALGMKLSEKIAADVVLPQTALGAPGNVLANLQQLQVVSVTGTALQVDAGTAPPAGGGFEVRRRDGDFGAGAGPDLVLRSAVRSFSIPRAAQVERYYVRMYDGSTPPVYSRFSSAVYTNVPVG